MLISSSLIKKLLYKGNERPVCPANVYHCYIIKDVKTTQTDSMMYGSYFETLCLGSGAQGNKTEDLPRLELTKKQELANNIAKEKGLPQVYYGDKSTAQVKIEAQAADFKRLCAKYQISIASPYNTQVQIYKRFDDEVMLVGELDIFPTPIMGRERLRCAIIDLKLTGDIESDWGEYCYGKPEELDDTQGLMYHYLVRDIDFNLNDEMNPSNSLKDLMSPPLISLIEKNDLLFLLWVFDYKKTMDKLDNKFIPVPWDKNNENEICERIRKTVSLLKQFEADGWKEVAGKHCSDCPEKLREVCPKFKSNKF